MKALLPLALALLAAGLGACSSTQSVSLPGSNALGRQILPLPPEMCLSFSAGSVERVVRATRTAAGKLPSPPADFGRPIASSVDLASLMAAVVHERGLAVVNLTSSETEPVWLPLAWTPAPDAVFVADAFAATLGGGTARVWDLTNAVELGRVDLAAWARERRLGPPVCAVPDRREPRRLTVVFSSEQRTDLQVIDFARGNPELAASASSVFENTKNSWYRVDRAAYDGETLFLSGTHEEVKLDTQGRPVPSPASFLMRIDLSTREHEILFHEDTHDRDQHVEELAAAAGRAAVLRGDGLLRVFSGREKVYEGRTPPGSALAWLSEDELAVFGSTALDVIRVAR